MIAVFMVCVLRLIRCSDHHGTKHAGQTAGDADPSACDIVPCSTRCQLVGLRARRSASRAA